jgi:hypothetical protein
MRRFLAIAGLAAALLFIPASVPATTLPHRLSAITHAHSQSQDNSSVKVWVNTSSGVYHCPGTRWYGATKRGEYMSQGEAQQKGYRPAYGRTCQSGGGESASPNTREKGGSSSGTTHHQGNPNVKVWVNTSSGVYHCPGTRWYGRTKRGEYMTQVQAQDAGDRPAYGKVCQ